MYIGVISMRYAKALLAYADEKGTEDIVYEEAGILADSFSRIPELRQALDNPVLPAETKLKLICEAAGGGKVSEELKRFVELVLEERREKFLQFMIMSYIDLYRKQKNDCLSGSGRGSQPHTGIGRRENSWNCRVQNQNRSETGRWFYL